MKLNIEHLAGLIVITLSLSGLWVGSSFNYSEVKHRTSNDTSIDTTELPQPSQVEPVAPTKETIKHNTVAIAKSLASPIKPIERIPGTKLDQKTLTDLKIDELPEEEQIFYITAVPNDAIYPQWYTTIIDAPLAWDTTTGSPTTTVAVIDTGFGLGHEDLTSAWYTNNGELGTTTSSDSCWNGTAQDMTTNNCDDDGNGYIDDWRGWDFANNDNFPQAGDNYAAGSTHGTKTSGLVGGRGNNSLGTASINWSTKILPLQALHDEGYGFSSDITAAIYYAVGAGVDVINLSLGGPNPDSLTRAAIQYALANNVVVVASSGNCGANQTDPSCVGFPSPGGMGYPASYPEVISVGATTSSNLQASFSSWGDKLDLVAPGSGTIQTPSWSVADPISLYAASSYGTSFSAPIVAGSIALIKSEFPSIKTSEILALISNSSDKVPGMNGANWTSKYGYGQLNANALLTELARYKSQLQKYDGPINFQVASNKPQISSNTGHSTSSGIVLSSVVKTYCVTVPNTLCSLQLKKQSSTTTVNFDAKLANNQGITIFEWSKNDASTGTWAATVTSGTQISNQETLIIL